MPDTCIKRKRHLVSKPVSIQSTPTSQSPPGSFTIAVCRSSPVITSSSDFHDHDLKSRKLPTYSLLKQRKSSSSSTGSGKRKERQEVNQSSLAVSPKQEDENQSGKMVEHSPCDSRQSEESKSTTEGGNSKKKRNRKRKRKSGNFYYFNLLAFRIANRHWWATGQTFANSADLNVISSTEIADDCCYVYLSCEGFLAFLFCCFTSQVNSYSHGGTVSSPIRLTTLFPGQA